MNCVDYAINAVCNSDIDPYLLKLAFESPNANFSGNWYGMVQPTTVEHGIREKVIHRTVMPSCNLNGGKTEFIDLTGSRIRDIGNGYIEVQVPDVLTGGRKIISVIEVYLGSMTSATGMLAMGVNDTSSCGQGSINDMMQGLVDSLASNRMMPPTFTNIHMTGNNQFVIANMNSGAFSMTAKCVLEYDEGMSSIHPRAYDDFAKLVNYAVKAYIFRTCRRPTQEAVLRAGVPLESIRDDIEEYRDAWTIYEEFRDTTWTKRMAYSDRQRLVDSVRGGVVRRT